MRSRSSRRRGQPRAPARQMQFPGVTRRDGAEARSLLQCPEPMHDQKRRKHSVCLHAGGSLRRATSRWSASTHSPTLPWFVTADWSPQYRQTLFVRAGADFVTMPLDDVRAAPNTRRRPQRSPRRVTAEHTHELYRLGHASRYRVRSPPRLRFARTRRAEPPVLHMTVRDRR